MATNSRRRGGDISAIFVHAGAGYHSHQNEGNHLQACSEYVLGFCSTVSKAAKLFPLFTYSMFDIYDACPCPPFALRFSTNIT